MSDGVTDSYNVCELCGERMFGHDYVKCHKASVKCLTAMHERIAELEDENKLYWELLERIKGMEGVTEELQYEIESLIYGTLPEPPKEQG